MTEWPQQRRVARRDDMSPDGKLELMLQEDGDVVVQVVKGTTSDRISDFERADVEFCVGGAGGGRSPRTRAALIALMVAIEADNAENPIPVDATGIPPQEDTMGVIGADGRKHHLFRTLSEEAAAVARSPLKVATDLMALAERVGAAIPMVAVPAVDASALIDAAEKYSENYAGQDIPADEVRAAINNAFFAGVKWLAAHAMLPPSSAQACATHEPARDGAPQER